MPQAISLTTSDGIEIAGIYRPCGHKRMAIFLHMMPATKESWDAIAERFLEARIASVAIDERGHGQSTMNSALDYRVFTDKQQQAKRLDVEAAIAFAKEQGFEETQLVLLGASIGANLAIEALTNHPDIPQAVALSAGLNFRGIKTEPLIRQLHSGQQVIFVASDDDAYSLKTQMVLHQQNPEQTMMIERSGLGHGTTMTEKDPALIDTILYHVVF